MRRSLAAGPLGERPFRVLLASTTVSGLGDGVARVALAFAVFEITDSATALGAVIAARQLANAVAVLAGGVWADRLPRERVLVGAALVQGGVQAGCAALLAGGDATVLILALLQAVYGAADGFVLPAHGRRRAPDGAARAPAAGQRAAPPEHQRDHHPRPGGGRDPARCGQPRAGPGAPTP